MLFVRVNATSLRTTLTCLFLSLPSLQAADFSSPDASPVTFKDVTIAAGIDPKPGHSWGLAWCDLGGDNYPDLWLGDHIRPSRLYLNSGGHFTLQFEGAEADKHGVGCVDFDNDGDQDLFESVGTNREMMGEPNLFYVNTGKNYQESARDYNIDQPETRGRRPVWLDVENDGDLDLLLLNAKRSDGQGQTSLYRNEGATFIEVSPAAGLNLDARNTVGGILSDVSGDEVLELLVFNAVDEVHPSVFKLGGQTLEERLAIPGLEKLPYGESALVRDFNNDLRADILITNYRRGASEVRQVSAKKLHVYLSPGRDPAFHFSASGAVRFKVWIGRDKVDILLGRESRPVDILAAAEDVRHYPILRMLTLQSTESVVQGAATSDPQQSGVFISHDKETGLWRVAVRSEQWLVARMVIEAEGLQLEGQNKAFDRSAGIAPSLFMSSAEGYQEQTAAAGLAVPLPCGTAGAGDFDNDMDVDIYLVCTGLISNQADLIGWNDGQGRFTLQPANQGMLAGRGDQVAVADYDRDGFLDLLVTNGRGGKPFVNGPTQLLRNHGNSNHWIEIRLVGSVSNRDAIGARVFVRSAGVTQLGEQQGGMNLAGQDDKILHFGLGQAKQVDDIEVRWPSGRRQTLHSLSVNQLIEIKEPE